MFWYRLAFQPCIAVNDTKQLSWIYRQVPSSSIRLTGKYTVVDWKIYYWGENHEDIKGNHINVTIDEYTATF